MAKYLTLPNGDNVEVSEGLSYDEALARAQQKFPEAFAPKEAPRTGLGAALSKGLEALVSSGRTGYEALTGSPEEAAKRGLERGKAMEEKYPDQVSLEKVKQAYEKNGLLSAAGEAVSQVPAALAEQAPNMAAMYAGAKAGQTAGSLFGTPGRIVGAGLGAAATGLASAFGSNIERQAAEQQREGKPVEIDRTAAGLAAVPQAALDVAGTLIPLGGRFVSKLVGIPEDVLVKRSSAQLTKLADEKLYTTLAKGLGTGALAEIPTEVAQQMLERAQAGLSLTSPDALKEYGETAYQVSLLAPLGAAGRVAQRSGARAEIQQKQDDEMAAERDRLAQAEEARLAALKAREGTEEYALEVRQNFRDILAKRAELDARANVKVAEDDLEGAQAKRDAQAERKKFLGSDETKQAIAEHNRLKAAGAFATIEEREAAQKADEEAKTAASERRYSLIQGQLEGEPETDLLEAARTRKAFKAPKQAPDIQGWVDFLISDPVRAQDAVTNRTQFPGLTQKQNEAVLGAVELELKQEKAYEGKQTERRASLLSDQMAGAANTNLLSAARERGPGIAPESAALQRIGESNRPAPSEPMIPTVRKGTVTGEGTQGKLISERLKSAQDTLSESTEQDMSPADEALVDELIKTLPLGDRVVEPGQVQRGQGISNYGERSSLITMLKFARETRNRPAAAQIIERLRALDTPNEVKGRGDLTRESADDLGEALGVTSMPEARAAEAAAERHIDTQSNAMLGFVRLLESMRRGKLVLPQTAKGRLDAFRNEYLDSHLDELDERRSAFGMPPMADWERGEARARVMEGFNRIEDDWGKPETVFGDVLEIQKDIRDNIYTTLANAATRFRGEQRDQIAEKTGTSGTQYYTEDAEGNRTPVKIEQPAEGKRIAPPANLTLRERREPESTESIATRLLDASQKDIYGNEGRRQRSVPTTAIKPAQKVKSLADIGKLSEQEKSAGELQGLSKESVDVLERIMDWLPRTSDAEFKALARDIVHQIEVGNKPNANDLRDLNEKIREFERAGASETRPGATPEELQRTSAQPQQSLFPEADVSIGRATPRNFQRMLDSKNIQGLRQSIADMKQATIDVLQTLQKTVPNAQNLLAKAESATIKARSKVKALQQNAKEDTTDEDIQKAWADAAREVVAAESALQSIPLRIKYLTEIRDSLAQVSKKDKQTLVELINAALNFEADTKQPAALRDSRDAKELTELKQWLDPAKTEAEIKRLNNLYRAANKAVGPARAKLEAALDKYDQGSVIRESLEREHQKALDALKRAEDVEREATRAVSEQAAQDNESAAQIKETDRKYKEALLRAQSGMGLPGIRVEEDMAAMRKRVQGLRGAMGSLEEQVNAEEDPIRKQELQEKYLAKQQELEQLTPPKKTTAIREEGEQLLGQAFEESTAASQAGVDARRRARAGEAAPKLETRIQGPVVRAGNTQRVVQTGVRRDKSNMQVAEQALNVVAKSRAELKEVQDRMDFLRTSGKAKVSNRYTPLFKNLQAREAQLKNRAARAEKAQAKIQTEQKQTAEALEAGKRAARPYKKDALLSRGVPVNGLTTTELRNELRRAVGDEDTYAKKVSVYESVQDFLDANPAYDGQIPFDAKAFVDPDTGRAYMFAENIGKNEGLGILLHEVGVHIGFRNFFNAAQFAAIAKTVRNWATAPANTLEGKIGRAAEKRAKEAGTSAEQMDDELIAYAVEEAVKAGVEPAGVKGGSAVANWLRMIVNAFNKALEKLGLAPEKLQVGDLVNMAYGAAQLELKGTWHGTGKFFTEFDHKYMGTGEGAQAFSWGTYRADTTGVANTYREQEASKQIDAWLKEPEMVAWAKSQEPKFGGKTAKEFSEFARTGKPGQELAGIPFEFAKAMAYGLEKYAVDAASMRTFSTLPPMVALKIKLKHAPRDMVNRSNLRAWLETADLSAVDAPSPLRLFRGRQYFELPDIPKAELSNEAAAVARDILSQLEYPTVYKIDAAKPFAAQVADVMDKLKREATKRFAMATDSDFGKDMQKRAEDTLTGLAELSPSDFTYNPPTSAPLPRPTGVMLRTLHGRKESEYLQWDLPWTDQPSTVDEAMRKAVDGLSKEQQTVYASILQPLVSANRTVKGKDFYDALGAALESDRAASELLHKYGVAGTKFLDRPSRNKPITDKSTFNYVDYSDKEQGAAIMGTNLEPVGPATGLMFSKKEPVFANPTLARAGAVADKTIAKQRGFMDAIKEEGAGLKLMTNMVDRFAPMEKLAKYMPSLKGLQMMYYLRMYDQRMNFVAQSVGTGALRRVEKTRADGQKEFVIESAPGASLKGVVNTLKDGNALVGSAEGNSRLFSMYLVAKRAERVGLEVLNYGGKVTEQDLQDVRTAVATTPGLKDIYDRAQREYNQYNRDMLQFAVDTGALSAKARDELLKHGDYVPYYRQRNGGVEMMLGGQAIAQIGSVKEQPYLQELVGGEEPILDFMTSAVQNTNMLADMSLRNLATKNAVYELEALGMAIVGKGNAASGPNVVKYKDHGVEKYAMLDTDDIVVNGKRYPTGIPADLVVKGMEGIPVQNTIITKLMGGPARMLRRFVVLNPLYAARQLFRDSLAAPMLAGADFLPVIGALRTIGTSTGKALERRGITGGQVFTGTSEDLTTVLRQISSGESSWAQGVAKLEALSMEADALTRRAQYNSYIAKGLSEMEATYMTLESMNFSKRGANPAMHTLSTVIPFFNAQIQSLNVLFKAFSGNMPFNEKLKIREKLFQRGMMMAAMTMTYAALMQDDEGYKNATPEQKYSNWFVKLPGMKESLRIPIPFEMGYIFKAIPEAIVNSMMSQKGGEDAAQAFKHIALQIIPGGSSYGIPQALRPGIEAGLGKSFYTGRDLESAHEKTLEPGQRARGTTTALARLVGEQLNLSPIKIDSLIQGYFSTTGLALADALSFALPSPERPVEATKRLSEMRVIGSMFQPVDANGVINATYDRMKRAAEVKDTYTDMLRNGRTADAQRYLQENLQDYALSSTEQHFTSYMQKITKYEQAVRASTNMTADEKRETLDQYRQLKIQFATSVRQAADKTAPR